jgi:hypothetical protein
MPTSVNPWMLNSITTWNSSHIPIPQSNESRLSKKSQRLVPLHTFYNTLSWNRTILKSLRQKENSFDKWDGYTSRSSLPPRKQELIIGTQHGKSKINLGTASGKILLNDHWRILYKGLEWSESHETQGSFELSSFSPCYMKPLPGYHHLRMA